MVDIGPLSDPFDGAKVAAVIDEHTVAINRGSNQGVRGTGWVLAIGEKLIIDPDTGKTLGYCEKLRVKVAEVYAEYCVAETFLIKRRDYVLELILGPPKRPEPVEVFVGDPIYATGKK